MAESEQGDAQPPPRRWRGFVRRIFRSHDFARDITVTTLGVLIALGIGEVVDEMRWKIRIAATESAMRQEAGLLHTVYIERQMLQPCLARRLSELGELLTEARRQGRLPHIQRISAPPNRGDYGDSWNMMLGTEIPLHIAPRELMTTATIWVNEDGYSDLVDRERNAFDRLGILENRPGPIDPDIVAEAEKQLVEASSASDSTYFIAQQDAAELARRNIVALYRPDVALNRAILARETRKRYICQPLQVDGQPYRLKGEVRQPRQAVPPSP